MPRLLFVDLLKNISDLHGICSIIACLKKRNIDVSFIAGSCFERLCKQIADYEPDLLLYSAFSADVLKYIEFDLFAKERHRCKSIIGGPGPTYDWTCIQNSTIDAACVGEGETALLAFVDNDYHSVPSIFTREEDGPQSFARFTDLDALPMPDRSLVYVANPILKERPCKQFISGRGCPFHCTYCFNHQFRSMFKECGPVIRKRSVDHLFGEINYVRAKYGLKSVAFSDDTFIFDKKWFTEFCERFPREIGLPYTCSVRSNLMDKDVARMLKGSGCAGVMWSIETADETLRNQVLRRGISEEQIRMTSYWLGKYQVPFRIGNMIGLPGESIEQMLATVRMNIEAKPNLAYTTIFVPYPRTQLTRYAVDRGYYDTTVPLPKDCFTSSPLNYSAEEKKIIQKLMCWFPLFVRFPNLFSNTTLRKLCLLAPFRIMKMVISVYFALVLSRLYVARGSLLFNIKMAVRFIFGR